MIARSVWRTANLYPGSAFGKLVRLPLRLVPPNTEIPILAGPLRGLKWISDSSNATCWMGVYESAKQQAFARIVKPGDVVFDLGANVGFYTLLASRLVGKAGRVFAFEPSPRNVWYLRRHLQINAIKNCEVSTAAVWSQRGIARFEISALPVTGHITNEISSAGYEVETVSLDGLLSEGLVSEPAVIKCDIEGGEIDLLELADLTGFNKILMEIHYWAGREAINRLIRKLILDGFSVNFDMSFGSIVTMHRGLVPPRSPA